jgi:hypothetical protein
MRVKETKVEKGRERNKYFENEEVVEKEKGID